MNMTRRALLRTTAIVPVAAALAACSSLTSAPAIASQVIDDIHTLANGVLAVLPALGAVQGIGADVVAKAGSAINQITAAADQIGATITQADALPIVQNIGANVSTLISVVTPFLGLLPPPFGTVLLAAQVLLPVIEAGIGLVTAKPATGATALTADQARLVLKSVAH